MVLSTVKTQTRTRISTVSFVMVMLKIKKYDKVYIAENAISKQLYFVGNGPANCLINFCSVGELPPLDILLRFANSFKICF